MRKHDRLIVFLIPPDKIVNGGILSIFSICKTSRQFSDIHKSEVMLSVYPNHDSYKKNDLFENDEEILSFDEIVKMGTPQSFILHVPEYASWDVYWSLKKYSAYLEAIPELSINIMLQNILLLQKPYEVANWFSLTPNVTQTTAHNKYSKQELADEYFIPTHHLSTFVDAKQYKWTPYKDKEKLIVLSPDVVAEKEALVETLKKGLPDYEFITIQNMRYEEYKAVMTRAKFAITFGEGFDGYFVEAFFTGGIALAVYNDEFFPDNNFAGYKNTFPSYANMHSKILEVISYLDSNKTYTAVVKSNLDNINKYYSFEAYTKNLENFYLRKYTYSPKPEAAKGLIKSILVDRDNTIDRLNNGIKERDLAIANQDKMIADKSKTIEDLSAQFDSVLTSSSWRVTKPLRKASSVIKNRKTRR